MTDQIDSHYHMRIAAREVFEQEASDLLKQIAGTAAGSFVLWDPNELDLVVITGDDIAEMKASYNEANPGTVRIYELRRLAEQIICEFEIVGREGHAATYLALGGLKNEMGEVQILFVREDAHAVHYALPSAMTLTDECVIRTGNLPIEMQKAFEACKEEGDFTYKGTPYTKLTADEVRSHVGDQQLRDSSAPEVDPTPGPRF